MLRLPNFIIIGAPKSGTTSLFYYLGQHPDVYLPTRKELHYFSYQFLEKHVNGPGDKDTLSGLCATKTEYEQHYSGVGDEKAVGEVSPSYLYYAEDVANRIFDELGQIKIIAIVRNPVDKAYSQYMHLIRDQREKLGFYEALQAEPSRTEAGWSDIWRYAESSLYGERLEKYIEVFGRENVKIIPFSKLTEAPQAVTKDVFNFLSVDDRFLCDTERIYNRTGSSRSKTVANFLSRPSPVKSLLKSVIPEHFRILIRLAILDWNTGRKEEIDAVSRDYLSSYFKEDIAKVKQLILET